MGYYDTDFTIPEGFCFEVFQNRYGCISGVHQLSRYTWPLMFYKERILNKDVYICGDIAKPIGRVIIKKFKKIKL